MLGKIHSKMSIKNKRKVYYAALTLQAPYCPKCHNPVKHGEDLTKDEKTMYAYKCKCGYRE